MSIKVNSQFNYGTNTFKSDTIKFEKFREGQLVKSVGTYPNQQLKYIRYDLNSQIMDTVSYYSKDGKRIADVEYMNLTYVLYDSSYIDNYLFIDTCIHKVKTIIDSKFDKNQLPNNLFLNYSSSYQLNLQKKGFAFSTKLYEPVSHSIDDVVIIFSFKPKEDEYNYRTLIRLPHISRH